MKTTDFEYKAPPVCIIKGCDNTPEWFADLPEGDIGLCKEHYIELEEVENMSISNFHKIEQYIQQSEEETFTVRQISEKLQITQASARKALNDLVYFKDMEGEFDGNKIIYRKR